MENVCEIALTFGKVSFPEPAAVSHALPLSFWPLGHLENRINSKEII